METAPFDSHVTIELSSAPADRRVQIMNYAQQDVRPVLLPSDANPDRVRERATELFGLGFKLNAVARRIGIQPKLLRSIMNGEPPSPAIERRIKVSALISAGHDLESIADDLGVDNSAVRDDLKSMRIRASQVSGKSRRMNERKREVLRLHGEGKTMAEISETLGLTHHQVRYTMNALGLEWRSRASSSH